MSVAPVDSTAEKRLGVGSATYPQERSGVPTDCLLFSSVGSFPFGKTARIVESSRESRQRGGEAGRSFAPVELRHGAAVKTHCSVMPLWLRSEKSIMRFDGGKMPGGRCEAAMGRRDLFALLLLCGIVSLSSQRNPFAEFRNRRVNWQFSFLNAALLEAEDITCQQQATVCKR